MENSLKKSSQKMQGILDEFKLNLSVVELPSSARTALEAANSLECTVEQIAKSIIFKGKTSQKPILVIASGTNRVNEKTVKKLAGENLSKADADFVLEQTGYVIGGIPPLGHKNEILTFIDEDLMQYDEIWAAAGNPNAVFKLTPQMLKDMTKAEVVTIL